jgi:serine/threonine protein phosphatase PrpC
VLLELGDAHPGVSFFAVFDGHAGGEVSLFLRNRLFEMVRAMEDPTDEVALIAVVAACDAEICALPDIRENGSTCICAVVKKVEGGKLEITVANVGDSRVLHIAGKTGAMTFLSSDHKPSLPEEEARIQAAGGMVQADRVNGQLAMSRAMGDYVYKGKEHLSVNEQEVVAVAEVRKITAEQGDVMLVCCDGIVEQLTNEQVTDIIYGDFQAQIAANHPGYSMAENGVKRDLDLAV